jgi:hypothetical protein
MLLEREWPFNMDVLLAWLLTLSGILMSALNLDIINLILDLLIWNHDGSVDRPSLAIASRINRLWRAPAQSRLFETVQILSRQELNSFVRSAPTSSRRGRQLRSMVLQLSIGISGHTSVMGVAPSHSLLERDMIGLLPTLPNLYILLVTSMASAITPDRKHQIFFNLLCALPLERAMFIGKGTYMWPSFIPPGSHTPVSPSLYLKELRIDLRHSQPSVKGSDLAWLLSHSHNSMEILHLYDVVLDPSMTPFILSVAGQLRSFHVSSSRQSDLKELPIWVEKMTSLQELVIRNDMRSAECFRVQTDFPRLMKVTPRTLQHLGLAVDSQIAWDSLKHEIKSWEERLGASLAVLTLVLTSTDPIDEHWQPPPAGRRLRLFHHTDPDVVFSFVSSTLARSHKLTHV